MNISKFCRKLVLVFGLLGVLNLGGCQTAIPYYETPPAHVTNGQKDFRLTYSQMISKRLEPIIVALPENEGKLTVAANFKSAFLQAVRPFDIILARSPAGFIRNTIPSYYTHALVWLGTKQQLKAVGVWNLPEFKSYRDEVEQGMVAVEAFGKTVTLIDLQRVLNRDELVILRPKKNGKCIREKILGRISENMGKPFDTDFDLEDKTRLTCIELAQAICPALKLPVRYSFGRLTLIPDDVVRFSIENDATVHFVSGFGIGKKGELIRFGASEAKSRLTNPTRKPAIWVY